MTLPSFGLHVGEVFQLINARGEILEFNTGTYLPDFTNFGTVGKNYTLRRGYLQDGETVINATYNTRALTLAIFQDRYPTRQEWWDARRALIDFFRTDPDEPMTLIVYQPDGSAFALDVYSDPGPTFAQFPATNDWNINEQITLKAYSPFWYNYNISAIDMTESAAENLIFPITFPIYFGTSGNVYSSGALNYMGTYKSYPTIRVTGPFTSARIELLTKGTVIQLLSTVVANHWREINTDPANIYCKKQDGSSAFDELGLPTNIADFFIPAAPDGEDEIVQVTLYNGVSGQSAATLTYRENYIGI